MNRITLLILCLLILGCSSTQDVVVEDHTPEPATGCEKYSADLDRWADCMETQFEVWERRQNAPLTREVMSSERVDWSVWVKERIRVCRADFCSYYTEKRKSPAWYHTWGERVVIATVFLGAGYIWGDTSGITASAASKAYWWMIL